MPAALSAVLAAAPQGSRADAAIGASALELPQLRLGGGRAGGVTLFAALSALGGTVDEDAMRNVVIGAALGLQVCITPLNCETCRDSQRPTALSGHGQQQ